MLVVAVLPLLIRAAAGLDWWQLNTALRWSVAAEVATLGLVGYFPVGDTRIRSNPKFGRGCTWAVQGAHILAATVREERDPVAQLHRYEQQIHEAFRSDWTTMLAVDRQDQRSFEAAAGLRPAGLRPAGIRPKLVSKMQAQISSIAVTVDPHVYREVMRGFYGVTSPVAWIKRPDIWLRILASAVPNDAKRLALQLAARNSSRWSNRARRTSRGWPMNDIELVTSFLAALEVKDLDRMLELMADDVHVHNMPSDPTDGRTAFRVVTEAFMASVQPEQMSIEVLSIVGNGSRNVVTERARRSAHTVRPHDGDGPEKSRLDVVGDRLERPGRQVIVDLDRPPYATRPSSVHRLSSSTMTPMSARNVVSLPSPATMLVRW